jgi:putative hydrolase of the HAD superfamily
VHSVLGQLRAQNIQLGVLSNFSLASLEQSLVTTGLAPYFQVACSAAVIGAAKPSAQAYKTALDALRVEPEECIFFDDEEECIEGARRLGLRAYLVDRQAPANDFQSAIVCNLATVPELVLNSVNR